MLGTFMHRSSMLPALHQRYPALELRIVEERSEALTEMVRNGDIDTAILALPFATPGLLTFEFWHEDFFWITHADSAHEPGQGITSDELKGSDLMLLGDGHCLVGHALSVCDFAPEEVDNSFASASLNTLVQMVAGKKGSTLVPAMALDSLLHNRSDLKALHIDEPGPHRTIAFAIRPNYADRQNIELMRDLFSEQLGQDKD